MDVGPIFFATCIAAMLRNAVDSCSYRTMPWDFLLIFLALAVVVPWRGWTRLQHLLALPAISSRDRISLYITSIATQWIVAVLIAWRAFSHGLSLRALGFNIHFGAGLWVVGILGGALIGLAHWFNLRRLGRSNNPAADRLKSLAAKIFPRSTSETIIFCCLAVTAGICEEFLYRGFVFAALQRLSLASWVVLGISSILFGLAHAYQGRGGMLGTLILGTVFGLVRILYDSFVPVMFWHAAVDVVAGIAGTRYLIDNK